VLFFGSYYYGPDSIYAEFSTDTCATILGLPTCGQWLPDTEAFLKLLSNQLPPGLGAWCFMGIVAASMSTADGAILAMGTVFSHNIVRQLDAVYPTLITVDNLLSAARLSTIPFTIIAAALAAFYQETGYLLIVAFDIVLAGVVAPLFGCFYAKNPSPRAALCSVMTGVIVRVTLEFALPKDDSLLIPYDYPEFFNVGPAASTLLPTFVDGPVGSVWDPTVEVCEQEQYKDFTGVDSLSAFLASILVFLFIQFVEHKQGGRALFTFPGDKGYDKDLGQADEVEYPVLDKTTTRTVDIDTSVKSTSVAVKEGAAENEVVA
jgi:Na+/proline symporter